MHPERFYFGAATAAHQVEGNNIHSDWWRFEKHIQARDGFMSEKATNQYELFDQDFEMAEKLGHDAHRFSIEWAKIEPKEGQFSEETINHYHEVFASLKKHGLKPFVTLWHFTSPTWFADKGGFENKTNVFYFERYCRKIAEAFKDEMEYVITINEPEVYIYYSYLGGNWPPQKTSKLSALNVYRNMIRGHKAAYKALKSVNPNFKIGVAKNNPAFSPDRHKHFGDRTLTEILKYLWNHLFLDLIKNHQDFIGLNYYFHRNIRLDMALAKQFFIHPCNSCERTDMGWELYPRGISGVLVDLWKRYKKPLVITENGLADHKDRLRGSYIRDILEHVFNAKKEGAHVFGYLHWSLLDNFEWAEGFEPRFGLAEVDYKTFDRKIRPSAYEYQKLIEHYRKQMPQV